MYELHGPLQGSWGGLPRLHESTTSSRNPMCEFRGLNLHSSNSHTHTHLHLRACLHARTYKSVYARPRTYIPASLHAYLHRLHAYIHAQCTCIGEGIDAHTMKRHLRSLTTARNWNDAPLRSFRTASKAMNLQGYLTYKTASILAIRLWGYITLQYGYESSLSKYAGPYRSCRASRGRVGSRGSSASVSLGLGLRLLPFTLYSACTI